MHLWSEALSLHSLFRSKHRSDSLAQLVEHNTFNVGVLGSNPRRITEVKVKPLKTKQFQGFLYLILAVILATLGLIYTLAMS